MAGPRQPRPGEALNVTRAEHENLESAVRDNARQLERLHTKIDTIVRDIAELSRLVRLLTRPT